MPRDKKPKRTDKPDKSKPKKGDHDSDSRGAREPVELEPELERLIGLATD